MGEVCRVLGLSRGLSFIALAVVTVVAGCDNSPDGDASHRVNGSVHVSAGKPSGSAETVNGSIHVDDNATVTSANTVNGDVDIGAHATAASVNTVNGSIALGPGTHVSGSAASVNGSLTLRDGADVAGALSNVNGKIELTAAHVAGGIKTVSGNISITGNSRVEGGILVGKTSIGFFHLTNDVPRIVIGPGASVQGDLRFERKVQLYVSDRATIGLVSGATPIQFSGENPPG
jgi:DUF4097 and DUF4098 domain-containing protein YvlB